MAQVILSLLINEEKSQEKNGGPSWGSLMYHLMWLLLCTMSLSAHVRVLVNKCMGEGSYTYIKAFYFVKKMQIIWLRQSTLNYIEHLYGLYTSRIMILKFLKLWFTEKNSEIIRTQDSACFRNPTSRTYVLSILIQDPWLVLILKWRNDRHWRNSTHTEKLDWMACSYSDGGHNHGITQKHSTCVMFHTRRWVSQSLWEVQVVVLGRKRLW